MQVLAAAAPDYGARPATLVSLSTLGVLVPTSDTRKFAADDLWEVPFCAITSIQSAASRQQDTEWHYEGCSACFRKQCDQHTDASLRPCYSMELLAWGRTASLDLKIFTRCFDEVLRMALALQPGEPVAPLDAASPEIRARKWALRCVIALKKRIKDTAGAARLATWRTSRA